MKQISTNLLAVLCVMLLLFTACKKNSDFTVEGVVSGADGQMMYLENVGVSTVELMDSVKLTAAINSALRSLVRHSRIFIACV